MQNTPVFINELHYDNSGTDIGEFIEIAGPAGFDLSGWSLVLYNGSNGAEYDRVVLSDTLSDGGSGGGVFVVAFTTNGLQNGSPDGIALVNPRGEVVQFLSYEGTFVAADGPAAGLTSTDIAVSEDSTTPVGGSVQLIGSGSTYEAFTWSAPADDSPGAVNTGQTFVATPPPPRPTPTWISQIQGRSEVSPLKGQIVTIEAIVIGDFQNGDADQGRNLSGFYVQEEDGDADADPLTSEGIFVFEGSNLISDVHLGDKVRISGTVVEAFGETQLDTITSISVVSTGNPLPAAATIRLPASQVTLNQNGRIQPDLEAFEGMRVAFSDTLSISELFQLDRFNEVRLVQGERPQQFTQFNAPDASAYEAYLQEVGARTIVYDDGLNVQNAAIGNLDGFGPGFNTANAPRMGDTISGLEGVLSYQWAGNSASGATWRVRSAVNGTNTFQEGNPRPTTPPDVGGSLKVASFNVLNFFATLDGGSATTAIGADPRGADNLTAFGISPATAEFDRQKGKLLTSILGLEADIVGLVEIENDFLNGSSGNAIAFLVDELNAVTSPDRYAWVDPGTQFVGDDAIAVGFLYDTQAVSLKGDAAILTTAAFLDPNASGENRNRATLAQTFEEIATGEAFTAVVNHFKSKGSSGLGSDPGISPDVDQGDGQGYWNDTRTKAAQALAAWLESDPTGSGDEDILILGDLNAYAKEDPITYLESIGYENLARRYGGGDNYSYVFDGQLGTLDYALANPSLLSQVVGAAEWHINANEADALDYNLDFGRDPAIFDGSVPYRSSDHDPVVVGLDLSSAPISSTFTLELLHIADQEAGAAAIQDAPRLSAVLNALRAQDLGNDGAADNTLTLSSGDAFIPGLFFDASEAVFGSGGIADIQIQNELGIQAIAFGNHEFDFGTATLAGLIGGSAPGDFSALRGSMLEGMDFGGTAFPYLSSNLDVSTDPNLAPLEVAGGEAPQARTITASVVIDVNGEEIGVVGATTPTLGIISSPGDVTITPEDFDPTPTSAQLDALTAEIQMEVDALLDANPTMNKVVLLAHMQQLDIERALAERLVNVDIIVGGGSNTRLFDDNDRVRAGDSIQGTYPEFIPNAGGTTTALVNTDGSYKYVGRLVLDFDADGNILPASYDPLISGAYATDDQGVADLSAEGLIDPEIQAIAAAIEAQILATEGNVFGISEVFLNGNRSGVDTPDDPDGVRTQETNLGNLTADANLAIAREADDSVVVSIKNGGGIRASIGQVLVPPGGSEAERLPNEAVFDSDGNLVKPEGGISQNDIQTTLAFNNGLTLLTLTKAELVAVLEHGVSGGPGAEGRFPQVSGVRFAYDPDQPVGDRILSAAIVDEASGAAIAELVRNGEVMGDAAETFRIVTLNFLAGGGDGYPFPTGTEANRADLYDLNADGADDDRLTGSALFAADGTEQDALAEYLASVFPADVDPATPTYGAADQGRLLDERIQNLNVREDTVFAGDDPRDIPRELITANPNQPGVQALVGTSRDEIIDGGNGPARLSGGGGSDVFVLNSGPGVVRITDFEAGVDFLGLANGLAFDDLRFTGNANAGARIRSGSDLLAVLEGVSPDALTAADVLVVADLIG